MAMCGIEVGMFSDFNPSAEEPRKLCGTWGIKNLKHWRGLP